MASTVQLLDGYLHENNLNSAHALQYPLFTNQRKGALSRAGICYVLKKYAAMARKLQPRIPEKVTPHVLRHTKAMHLLQAGVNSIYIRDILGHVDISTTEIYAKADLKMKQMALAKVSHISEVSIPSWATNKDLLTWLDEYGKSLK